MVRLTVGSVLMFALLAVGQECPADSGSRSDDPPFGAAIPQNPDDVPSGCSAYEVLEARGTSEPGTFGYRVGDPLIGNVTELLAGSRGYPVQYPASGDFTNSMEAGAADVAARIAEQIALCPEQTFSLVGYSQGAMVMHRAAELIPESSFAKIKSVVTFGDPYIAQSFPGSLNDNVLANCAYGDQVCDSSGAACTYAHISYTFTEWMSPSAEFIVDAFTS